MRKYLQFTNIPELLELFPLDKWSRQGLIKVLGKAGIGYAYTPTTMGEMSFRIHTKEEFDRALKLAKVYYEEEN